MSKFSVIIATIWKPKTINQLLTSYYNCDNIEEVILINNDRKNTPDFPRHPKLIYLEPDDNIYVNPALNMGVRLAKMQHLIISNDDVLFDVEYLTQTLNYLINQYGSLSPLGMIGMSHENYNLENDLENPTIREYSNEYNKGGWACIFAFHKERWKNIPEKIKIYYGDNWIHMYCKPILELLGLKITTKMSESANTNIDWVKKITDNDTKEWFKLLGINQ